MRWVALLIVVFSLVGCTSQTKQPTKDANAPQYISREQAVEATLQILRNVKVKDAVFVENYQLEPKDRGVLAAAWVVELISKHENIPAGKAVVDALTGEVVSFSNPPSGQ